MTQQLLNSDNLLRLRVERVSVGLEHLERHERKDFLHACEDVCPQEVYVQPPVDELDVCRQRAAPRHCHLPCPHTAEALLNVV